MAGSFGSHAFACPLSPMLSLLPLLQWVLFLHREIFQGSDRERREYIGGDMTIVREVDAQLNNLNKAFPVMGQLFDFPSDRQFQDGGEGEQFLVLLHAFMVPSNFILVQDAPNTHPEKW